MRFKLGTFSLAGAPAFPGLILDGDKRIVPLSRLQPLVPRLGLQLRQPDSLLSLLCGWEDNFAALAILAQSVPDELAKVSIAADELHTHAPLDPPRQIFCTIANYRGHIIETVVDAGVTDEMDPQARRQYAAGLIEERLRGAPYACLKLPSAVIGPTDPLELPRHAQRVDWELELGVVIGKSARRVSRSEAMSYIAGYVLANDITARDQVRRADVPSMGTDWLQSKNAPGFLPLGPYLVPAAFLPDPSSVRLTLAVNDRRMQDGSVTDMLFDIATQIEYISQHARLLPGDVICTGTPAGCGTHYKRYLQPGDVIHASAGELGSQHTPCVAEATRSN
jgi:2-keto-4-pentenoate hydratase/2-oxohepta-3-ene-1,7-dioic acid hydratase in catechol pathway